MYRVNRILAAVVCVTCVASTAFGATIVVKQDGTADATSIQAALMAASDGDTIEIADDETYVEDVTASPVLAQAGIPAAPLASFTLKAREGNNPVLQAANAENSQRMAALGISGRDMLGLVVWGCKGVTIQGIEIVNPENSVNGYNVQSSFIIADCEDILVERCTIRGPGEASPGEGNAVLVAGVQAQPFLTNNITIRDCLITESHYGIITAVFQKDTGVDPNKVVIEGCIFQTGFESAIDIDNALEAIVRDCTITDYKHGIHFAGGNSLVEDCLVIESKEEGFKTDIDENWNSEIIGGIVRRCAFVGNGVENPRGGVRLTDGPIQMENCIIAGNYGPGVWVTTASTTDVDAVLDHCDIYQNQGDFQVHIQVDGDMWAKLTMTNCNVVGDADGFNNEMYPEDVVVHHNNVYVDGEAYVFVNPEDSLSVDPLYVGAAADPASFTSDGFQLQPDSPVLSAGVDGTYIGSQGVQETRIETWMIH